MKDIHVAIVIFVILTCNLSHFFFIFIFIITRPFQIILALNYDNHNTVGKYQDDNTLCNLAGMMELFLSSDIFLLRQLHFHLVILKLQLIPPILKILPPKKNMLK